MNNNEYSGLEIAVIGISIRTSGSSDWRSFWSNLELSKESLRDVSEEELLKSGLGNNVINDKNFVKRTTNIFNKDSFDNKFFKYTNDEARMMYPAHRFFHECVWEALEDAGCIPENIPDTIGLYAGADDDLIWKSYVSLLEDKGKVNDFFLSTISNKDYLTSLISYKLGLRGPSLSINTACSTSLVAIHTACRALILGETKIAIAGASSINNSNIKGYMYEEGGIISKDGYCRAFDINSTGTVNGEGTGVVVLKRLKDALQDNDNIYALVKGSAVNNDGNAKIGYTAPSIEGQVMCIKMAQKFANVNCESINYIETHGTGTKLGDSIEIEALNAAFYNNNEMRCPIGSIKTNIGHLDSASGVAGFIKTVLSLKNKKLPASLHFKKAGRDINFSNGPFYVNDKLVDFKRIGNKPLRAGVNSFGVGGTNAHVILEEAPVLEQKTISEPNSRVIVLSAASEKSLLKYLDKFRNFIHTEVDVNLDDLCYTYQKRRKNFDFRVSFSFNNIDDLKNKLDDIIKVKRINTKNNQAQESIVFIFPGQGSQYLNMGKDLYESNAYFKDFMDKGFELLNNLTGKDYKKILYYDAIDSKLNETTNAQPLIFIFEYALSQLLISFGIMPNYMIGHSLGEYVAACLGGLFSFEDALKLVIKRSELMGSIEEGMMLSIALDEVKILQFLDEDISIAAINGPNQIVVSGKIKAISKLMDKLDLNSISYIKLRTSHAFHSCMQDCILDKFKLELEKVEFKDLKIPFISNLTGNIVTDEQVKNSDYWVKQLRNTVNFSKGIVNNLINENMVFIEVGAGLSLSSLVKQHWMTDVQCKSVNLIKPRNEIENDLSYLVEKLGVLWSYGVNVNWEKLHINKNRRCISLPTYAFEESNFPSEVNVTEMFKMRKELPLINELKESIYFPSWKRSRLNTKKSVRLGGFFLVFDDDSQYSQKIIEDLHNAEVSIIKVIIGESYKKKLDNFYEVNPYEEKSFQLLFKDFEEHNIEITNVIYLWSNYSEYKSFSLEQDNLLFNLLFFCQAKIVKYWQSQIDSKFIMVTNNLHKVNGNEHVNFLQSLVIGVIKALPIENQISVVNLDYDSPEGIVNSALEFLYCNSESEQIIAYRNGLRWTQYFEKDTINYSIKDESLIKKKGMYVVTGGLGNLSYTISEYLISQYNANIILIGKNKLDDLKENSIYYDRWQKLKKLSDNVVYFDINMDNSKDVDLKLENHIRNVEVNGVVYLLEDIDNKYTELYENCTYKNVIKMLTPMINGVQNVYNYFKDYSLDFFWSSSSLSVSLGKLNFTSYIAGYAFIDSFVDSKQINIKSVQLPHIDFGVEENLLNLSKQEFIESFEMTLNMEGVNVVCISKESIESKLTQINIFPKETPAISIEDRIERPLLQTEYIAAQTKTEKKLQKIFESFFEIKNIGVYDDYFDLGGDSLKAIILLKKITKEFDISISISDFFLCKNIASTGNLIDNKIVQEANRSFKNEIII